MVIGVLIYPERERRLGGLSDMHDQLLIACLDSPPLAARFSLNLVRPPTVFFSSLFLFLCPLSSELNEQHGPSRHMASYDTTRHVTSRHMT